MVKVDGRILLLVVDIRPPRVGRAVPLFAVALNKLLVPTRLAVAVTQAADYTHNKNL